MGGLLSFKIRVILCRFQPAEDCEKSSLWNISGMNWNDIDFPIFSISIKMMAPFDPRKMKSVPLKGSANFL